MVYRYDGVLELVQKDWVMVALGILACILKFAPTLLTLGSNHRGYLMRFSIDAVPIFNSITLLTVCI